MLYHNGEKLTKEKFENPGSEYRAAPFWAWNCKMTEAEIDNTLDALKAMGMGGDISTAVQEWTILTWEKSF